MAQGRKPSGPLCDSLREVWGLQVASGLRPAEIFTWDPGTSWVAEEGRWREARPPRPWGNQAEVFSPRNSEDVGHEQPLRGQVWDRGVGGGPGALPAPPLRRSRGASQQHGRASTTTGAPLVEILPGDPGQVGQPGDREVGSRVALGPIPPRLSLPPLVTSCLRSHPTPPASPPHPPNGQACPHHLSGPGSSLGRGGRPSSVGEALGPQGLLGPVSPGPLSAQSPGLPCDLPHTPRRASFPPSHALPPSPQGAWAPLPHPTVPGLPEDSGVGWGCRPKADSAPLLLICVTRANPPLREPQCPQSVAEEDRAPPQRPRSVLPSSRQNQTTGPARLSGSLPGRPFLSSWVGPFSWLLPRQLWAHLASLEETREGAGHLL